jgi:hypothetical protein
MADVEARADRVRAVVEGNHGIVVALAIFYPSLSEDLELLSMFATFAPFDYFGGSRRLVTAGGSSFFPASGWSLFGPE